VRVCVTRHGRDVACIVSVDEAGLLDLLEERWTSGTHSNRSGKRRRNGRSRGRILRPISASRCCCAGLYRIRAGDYRVVYAIADARLVVLVLKIGNRLEVHEKLRQADLDTLRDLLS
jgi:hypothetical protein